MSKVTEKPDKNSELGTLIVVLLKARNLNDKHSFRKQDVFAQATLNGVQKRSHVDIRGGQHPEWDSEARFTVLKDNGPGGKNRKLEVACYAQEPRKEELLGQSTVDISDTLKTGEFDDWVSLDVDGVVRGDIYLEMTYYANAPTPAAAPSNKLMATVQGNVLGRRPSKLSPSNRLSRPIQQNTAGPSRFSPEQPSRLHDQFNPTSSHLTNAVPSITKIGSLLNSPADEPVHANVTLPNTLEPRSLSPPQVVPSQLAVLPSILRPGLGSSSMLISNSGQQHNVGHNRTLSQSSISSNNRPHSTTPDVCLSQPDPYTRGSGVHSGLSNINDPLSSNPYIMDSGAYIAGQQHQQVPGGRAYSPTPPGAFIPENQPGPDGRSYSPASRVQTSGPPQLNGDVSLNPYVGVRVQQQRSGGRAYSPVPSSVSEKVSVPSHPSVPISISSPNPYTGNSAVYLPEKQTGLNVSSSSYSPAPRPISVQASGSPNIDHSAPIGPHAGGSGTLIPGHQQAPDGRGYSSAQPVNTAQTPGYANCVASLQALSGPPLPYHAGTESSSVLSGSPAFPMPVIPVVVMEPYGYQESSSYMRPGFGGRSESSSYYQLPLPPRTSLVSNNRSEHKEVLDPSHLARYQTPLPLPPGSVKENPPPPLTPATATPVQVSPPSVAVAPAAALDTTHVEALRKMEQDSVRRKEQELKDLEFAMQLDRELNL